MNIKIVFLLLIACNLCCAQIINSDGILVSALASYSDGSAVQRVIFTNLKKMGGDEIIPESIKAYVPSKNFIEMTKNRNVYLVIKKNGEKWDVVNYWIKEIEIKPNTNNSTSSPNNPASNPRLDGVSPK